MSRQEKQFLSHLTGVPRHLEDVLRGNDLRLARSWAFAWEEIAMAFVSNTACVHKESQKQKGLLLLSTSTILASLVKLSCFWLKAVTARGEKHQNSSCWKPQYCTYRDTDSVYHHLDIHSGQWGGLVPQSLCLC